MKPFLPAKRKLVDLLVLLGFDLVFYFLWNDLSLIALFSFGFVWNWCASQDLSVLFENKRSRYSTLRNIVNIQALFLKPFRAYPPLVQLIPRILPAGIFWGVVILFNGSSVPWWAPFLGSLVFELVQLERSMFRRHREELP